MSKHKSKSWIIIDHPVQFLLACNLSILLKNEYDQKSVLLISKHEYWKHFNLDEYKQYFSEVHWFDRLDFPPPGMNFLKQIVVSFLLFPQLLVLKARLSNLKINEDDLIFGLSNGTFLENIITSNYCKLKKIAIIGYQDYEYWLKKPSRTKFRMNFAIKITQFINSIFKMHKTVFLYRKNTKTLGDGDYYVGYAEKINRIFDTLILTVGDFMDFKKTFSLDKNTFLTKYPKLLQRYSSKKNKKKIIFLGENYIQGVKIDRDIFTRKTNEFLNYLREQYAEKYTLIYKPHPNETNEIDYLDLVGFEIIKDKRPAEIYFTENIKNIKAVFSTVSSAIMRSYCLGIDSYLFLKLLPFDKVRFSTYNTLFMTLPNESYILNLKTSPKRMANYKSTSATSFEKVIEHVIL